MMEKDWIHKTAIYGELVIVTDLLMRFSDDDSKKREEVDSALTNLVAAALVDFNYCEKLESINRGYKAILSIFALTIIAGTVWRLLI